MANGRPAASSGTHLLGVADIPQKYWPLLMLTSVIDTCIAIPATFLHVDSSITGMQAEYCIDTTCKVAFEYGFQVITSEKTNTTFYNGIFPAKDLYNYYKKVNDV